MVIYGNIIYGKSTRLPIIVTLVGITIDVNLEQLSKALLAV
jgi:hypothetical protein